jgi:hypothetical protein
LLASRGRNAINALEREARPSTVVVDRAPKTLKLAFAYVKEDGSSVNIERELLDSNTIGDLLDLLRHELELRQVDISLRMRALDGRGFTFLNRALHEQQTMAELLVPSRTVFVVERLSTAATAVGARQQPPPPPPASFWESLTNWWWCNTTDDR